MKIHRIQFALVPILLALSANSQQFSCIQGFAYNATYSSCMPTSISCPPNSTWNNQYCAFSQNCPPNTVSSGTSCIPYSGSCPSGYYGNPSQCFRCPTGFVQYYNMVQCTINFGNCTSGNYWTGAVCSSTNPQSNPNINTITMPSLSTPTPIPQNINTLPPSSATLNTPTPVQGITPSSPYPINQPQFPSTTTSSSPSITISTTTTSASLAQFPTGQMVACIEGYYWTGAQCASYNGVYTCISNFYWNGTHCSNSTASQQPQIPGTQ